MCNVRNIVLEGQDVAQRTERYAEKRSICPQYGVLGKSTNSQGTCHRRLVRGDIRSEERSERKAGSAWQGSWRADVRRAKGCGKEE